MAAAIFVFFWALDRVRKERVTTRAQATLPRATPRELVERLLKPAAENLSLRRRVQGKPTLGEDLARGPQHHRARVPADPHRRGRPRRVDRPVPFWILVRAG